MEINEYQELAMKTLNKALDKKDILVNAVMGLCGEAGEATDLVKKHLFQNHEFNKEDFIKELGDIAWYLAEACTAVDVDLEEVLEKNITKLKLRFPNGFDKNDSIKRVDEK
ncbi:MAG: nucleoside triphosphate pyrophosphohydrolase family protein [Roseburia sp.]|nr:nucleoside triphosphate pyrophosphohydrolase family protein [Anaeroplasma bactoclasticum]MCM1196080.1 nucleoside triphosphate pyrophosphohydrolase family protein [Roseburia sp.]MCM1557865.1 nucleoside triphosphate pyrophosphohydrolase family protein [Anaeroplasma bactoclasticum]